MLQHRPQFQGLWSQALCCGFAPLVGVRGRSLFSIYHNNLSEPSKKINVLWWPKCQGKRSIWKLGPLGEQCLKLWFSAGKTAKTHLEFEDQVVASLSPLGGQDKKISPIFPLFLYLFSLIFFTQIFFIFFFMLIFWVSCPSRKVLPLSEEPK